MARILYVDTRELRDLAGRYRAGAEAVGGIRHEVERQRRTVEAAPAGSMRLPASLAEGGYRVARQLADVEHFLHTDAANIARIAGRFERAEGRSWFNLAFVGTVWPAYRVNVTGPAVWSGFDPDVQGALRSAIGAGRRFLERWSATACRAGRAATSGILGLAGRLRTSFQDNARRFRDRLRAVAKSLWNRIWSRVTALFNEVRNAIGSLVRTVASAFRSVGEVISRAGRWVTGSIGFVFRWLRDSSVGRGIVAIAQLLPPVAIAFLAYHTLNFLAAIAVETYFINFRPGSIEAAIASQTARERFGAFGFAVVAAIPGIGFIGRAGRVARGAKILDFIIGTWGIVDSQRGTANASSPAQPSSPPRSSPPPPPPRAQGPGNFSQADLVRIAESQNGQYQPPLNADGTDFGAPGQCMMWVDRWLESAGQPGGLPGGTTPFEKFDQLGAIRIAPRDLQPGDIFQRARPGTWDGNIHTAVVKSFDPVSGQVTLIEGNVTPGTVTISSYTVDQLQRTGVEVRFYRLGKVN